MYRGENRLVGWEYRSVANVANRCLLRMIVSTDIKVSVFTGMATWYNIPHIRYLMAVKIVFNVLCARMLFLQPLCT